MNPYKTVDPYAAAARFYGRCLDPVIIRWKRKAMRLYRPRRGAAVLDVGSGTGAQLNLYHSYGCRVFGIELSAGMIAAARQKYHRLSNLCRGNAARMPYRDQAFDLILLSMMLHEIPPDIRQVVLAETERVLKDSGRVLIIDYRAGHATASPGRLFRGLITLVEMAAGRPHFENYRNFMKTGGLPPLLKNYRLTIDRHDTAGSGNIGLHLLRKDLSKNENSNREHMT
ncbi:MAG: class I SAM-dependent methyltransferase [Thermodesulfobacteriota bacterium]